MEGVAVAGNLTGRRLVPADSFQAYWFAAVSMFPDSLVFNASTHRFDEVGNVRAGGVPRNVHSLQRFEAERRWLDLRGSVVQTLS